MEEPVYKASAWQQRYHDCDVDELLGAGSAGPGKTECLIHEPLVQVMVEQARVLRKPELVAEKGTKLYELVGDHPLHPGDSKGWWLFLRRTSPRLLPVISRMQRVYPRVEQNVRWSAQEMTWHWSSGLRIQCGHCVNRDDWLQYQGSELCVAKGTRIVMGDGKLKPVENVSAGDMVMTLEGPARVSATHRPGVKACVGVSISYRGEIVGRQRHPTTHPVLAWPTGESTRGPSPHTRRSETRSRHPSFVWQDYESLLCGRSESPVERVSRLDRGIGCGVFGGSALGALPLPVLCVPVVLHAPSLQRARAALSSTEYGARPPSSVRGVQSILDGAPLRAASSRSFPNGEGTPARPDRASMSLSYGGACGPLHSGTATGSLGRCYACLGLRGERSPTYEAAFPDNALQRVCGPEDIPTGWQEGDRVEVPRDTGLPEPSYPHFYTGQHRVLREEIRRGTATFFPADPCETFDLTVDGPNHYITEYGLVNCNTGLIFDELVEFEEEQYDQIRTRVRTTDPVLRYFLKVRAMSNPVQQRTRTENFVLSNPYWVRDRFVDPAPQGGVRLVQKVDMGGGDIREVTRMYLPARLDDNPNEAMRDQYKQHLKSFKPHIQKALLEGDWYVTAGSYYGDAWDPSVHICKAFDIPDDWDQFRALDWGFKHPGCCLWGAIDHDGNLYVHREYDFAGKDAQEVAREIRGIERDMGLWSERSRRSRITGPADTQLWEERGDKGKSKVSEMAAVGVYWVQANKRSRARNGQRIYERLVAHDRDTRQGSLIIFEGCTKLIRTLPAIQTDPADESGETPAKSNDDDAVDALGYMCEYASNDRVMHMAPQDDASDLYDGDDDELEADRGQDGYGG